MKEHNHARGRVTSRRSLRAIFVAAVKPWRRPQVSQEFRDRWAARCSGELYKLPEPSIGRGERRGHFLLPEGAFSEADYFRDHIDCGEQQRAGSGDADLVQLDGGQAPPERLDFVVDWQAPNLPGVIASVKLAWGAQ